MTAGFLGRVPRVALLAGVVVLATATLTFAATSTTPPATPAPAPAPAAAEPLVVPDVRGQAYVFAKGTLEESGFAWRVEGAVRGYAANTVSGQTPAPGTKLVDNGSPTVVLTLAENGSYEQEGVPENAAPYTGAPARPVGAPKAKPKPKPAAKTTTAPKPAAKPVRTTAKAKPRQGRAPSPDAARTPAFTVDGAPAEPQDEITLAERAERLAAWVEAHPKRTPKRVQHWLYQHTWIVTGARFGWSHGAEALATLIEVDRRVQRLWGVGARSEKVARNALAFVAKRSR